MLIVTTKYMPHAVQVKQSPSNPATACFKINVILVKNNISCDRLQSVTLVALYIGFEQIVLTMLCCNFSVLKLML